jgi:lipoprotein-releasing system ATP-binding protein
MLEAKNIHKVYSNGKKQLEVLRGVNLNIEEGRFIAVVGPSGAGKSTLLHILGGLDAPTQGEVAFEGENIYRLNDTALAGIRNKKIGFVFQFYHLLSEFTVLENAIMPSLISNGRRNTDDGIRKQALTLLSQVGLGDRTNHFPAQLSGGEKQRLAIVRSLMNKPRLLLCDEPTGNLDSKTGAEIVSLIKKINLENRMSVVLVTHNAEIAAQANNIYHLQDGILVD